MFQAVKQKAAIKLVLQKLEVTQPGQIPYIFFKNGDDCEGKTVFDIVVKAREVFCIQKLINVMLNNEHIGILYNTIIDMNLDSLLKLGIDMRQYFESAMAFKKLEGYFPLYHVNPASIVFGGKHNTIKEILTDYHNFIEKQIDVKTRKGLRTRIRELIFNPPKSKRKS